MWGVVEDLEELKEENEYNLTKIYCMKEANKPHTYKTLQMKSLAYTVNRCL